jgi:hypothetical protein
VDGLRYMCDMCSGSVLDLSWKVDTCIVSYSSLLFARPSVVLQLRRPEQLVALLNHFLNLAGLVHLKVLH